MSGEYILHLDAYEAANLMKLVDAIYRIPHEMRDGTRVSPDTPISRFNSGDWIGQIWWKLQAEVGDEYPVPPNKIYEGEYP